MFDLSFGELLLIAVAALVFIGPKELPGALKGIMKLFSSLKQMMQEVTDMVQQTYKEAGLDEVKEEWERETRTIIGDDGKPYTAYDLDDFIEHTDVIEAPSDERPS